MTAPIPAVPGSNFTVDLNNTLNIWTGPLYMGTPDQYLLVPYQTVTPVTMVEANCAGTNCSDYQYDPANSTTAEVDLNTTDSTNAVLDNVTVSLESQGIFFAFVEDSDAQTYSGNGGLGLGIGDEQSPSYVDQLYNHSRIANPIVSWVITT